MRVGILECDHVAERHRAIAGDFADMFQALLVDPLPDGELVTYDVRAGSLPASPDACDVWIGTGSRASAYDDEPWIAELCRFVREVRAARSPFVGICFGHQVLAHALGGRVVRAANGWGAGAHRLEVVATEPWMEPAVAEPTLLFMHQDQVVELPEGGRVLARTAHCPVAMLAVDGSMLGIQAHPEFTAPFVDALLRERRDRIGAAAADSARRSLATPTDERTVAGWMARFVTTATERRRPRTSR